MTPVSLHRPDPQLIASDPGVSAFVTANAGSGKTTTLVRRVARLLLQGARPDAILCVTYTKAAAAEMQSRLFAELGAWAVMDDAELRKALADIDEARRQPGRARRLFALALETPGGLKIQTIHAFCEKLLRRFPLEAGVSPKFQVAEDAVAAEIAAEARDAVALRTVEQPAGALAEAYAWFAVALDHRAFQEMFAGFEARRAAIAIYVERIGGADQVSPDVWTRCTGAPEPTDPDAVGEAAARAIDVGLWRRAIAALRAGGKSDCDCADALEAVLDRHSSREPAWPAACEALFTAGGSGTARTLFAKSRALAAAGLTQAMQDEIARLDAAREAVRAACIARNTVHALTLAAAYSEAYGQIKRARSALDFADLVERTSALLRTRADAAWVLYKLDGGIDHVLVDEAQDTAPEQWAIVRALTAEFFAGSGVVEREHPRTMFAVGDEKQSIYSFQGARPERLIEETHAYERLARGAALDFVGPTLDVSYRSTPQVLAFVDAVFAGPAETRALTPDRENIPRHLASREGDAGCVDLWPTFVDEKSDDPDWWEPLDAEGSESARKRLAFTVAKEIDRAVRDRDGVYDKRLKTWRAARPGDFLILVRRRGPLFEEILRALKKASLPVAGADRLKLSEHAAFGDLLALARFALYPGDDLTVAELLRSPFCDVPENCDKPDSLYALAHGRKGSLWRNLRDRAGEHPRWAAAVELLTWARRSARKSPPYAFFAGALTRRDATGATMRRRLLERLGAEADEAIEAFLAEVLTLEARVGASLESVVAALEQADVTVKRELDEGAGEVRVMTVHGAKGLEAPVVILPDTTQKQPAARGGLVAADDGGFLWCGSKKEDCDVSAEARAGVQQREDDEYLRLFYVALTRARDRLILCGRRPGNIGDKAAADGSWWDLAARAFDRLETRGVQTVGLTIRRFGPNPAPAPSIDPANDDAADAPAWLTAPPAAEPLGRYSAPSELAARRRGAAPSPLSERGGLGRFRRGALIHRLLQLLPDLPAPDRAAGAVRLLSREPDLATGQAEEIARVALSVLSDARFAPVFGPGSRAEAAIAGAAPELPAGLAISGRVDRLVVAEDHVSVIDFKTHRPPPARAEDADPADLAQMATYVAVLRRIFPGRSVQTALLWTDGPSITPLSDSLVADTLATLGRVAEPPVDSYIADPD